MRDKGGKELFDSICEAFGQNIERHMSVYGAHNEERLTGLHETQSIDEFSYGVSDRGASIRVPASVPTRRMGWTFGRQKTSIKRRPVQDWCSNHYRLPSQFMISRRLFFSSQANYAYDYGEDYSQCHDIGDNHRYRIYQDSVK